MNFQRFSTDPFPFYRRSEAWNDALYPVGLAAGSEAGPLEGRLLRHAASQGGEIALIGAEPQSLTRIGNGGHVWLGMLVEGEARLPGGDAVHERALFIVPAIAGRLLDATTRFRLLLIGLPRRDPLGSRLGELAEAAEAGKPMQTGPQPVLGALFAAIAEAMDAAPAMLPALDAALGRIMPEALAAFAGGEAKDLLRRRILRALGERLDDPHLNLARFAAAEGISVRAVQKLLTEGGRSFSDHLRHHRLERAAAALADPVQASLPVGEIGFRCGFPDPAHFSRAFRRHHGVAPNAYRAGALSHAPVPPPQGRSRGQPQPNSRRAVQRLRSARIAVISARDAPAHHHLRATPETVHWGYFSRALLPVLTVRSGDTVTVETLTQHASDDTARMIAGDADAEAVFHWTSERKSIDRRGAGPLDASTYGRGAGEGFGVHILTGPIMVEEARPGDVLEVEILGIAPRPSSAPGFEGRCFGSNAAAWWGRHYDDLLTGIRPREVITLYEIVNCGDRLCAHAVHSFRWTAQRDPAGILHPIIDYPGVPVDPASIELETGILQGVHVPVRPHFGTIGLAPDHPDLLDSVPPSAFGGNIDNWRFGASTKLFLPVSLPGAMLSIGDPHAAQGDGEVSGTAIECSMTGTIRLRLHPRGAASAMLRDLNYPLIETPESWVVQGFSYADYLADIGSGAQSEIYKRSSLDAAMQDAFRKARRFLITAQALSEDEAISLLSVAVDFGITQVVDGNWGVHAVIPKAILPAR